MRLQEICCIPVADVGGDLAMSAECQDQNSDPCLEASTLPIEKRPGMTLAR
jgi:hypothetical protein